MGALVWPYATASGNIALPDRVMAERAGEAAPTQTATVRPASPGLTARSLIVPVAGIGPEALADTFTQARGEGRLHDAIDITAREGTPVVAAAAGRVEKLYRSDAGGNTIYVRSPDGRVMFYYAHLKDYAPGLAEGQVVAPGDALGSVGWTGNADQSAPHLHLAMQEIAPDARWWEGGAPLNPYPLLVAGTY
ncbi:peptidoglycan DD-metalloendopeptidase family protein [Altererythrobacter buctensis]|uniref:Peptidoglycan DD-metalloendopeptidase family protein n=2 Tax=Alteraurantiacibacter buctensis TaxID=1503981 RepID=A0A844YVU2_9SPHN|nr:peptidoglycan DD-metalloendopeptidase family protein [Alteraurantiacibacter buctensis]